MSVLCKASLEGSLGLRKVYRERLVEKELTISILLIVVIKYFYDFKPKKLFDRRMSNLIIKVNQISLKIRNTTLVFWI